MSLQATEATVVTLGSDQSILRLFFFCFFPYKNLSYHVAFCITQFSECRWSGLKRLLRNVKGLIALCCDSFNTLNYLKDESHKYFHSSVVLLVYLLCIINNINFVWHWSAQWGTGGCWTGAKGRRGESCSWREVSSRWSGHRRTLHGWRVSHHRSACWYLSAQNWFRCQ